MAFIVMEETEEEILPEGRFQLMAEEVKPEETFGKAMTRHAIRSGSRIAETLAGLPGDISQLLDIGIDYLAKKAGAPTAKEISEKAAKELGITPEEFERVHLPTSMELRKGAQWLIGDYIKPQSAGEEFSDEVISDVASLVVGRKAPASGGLVARAFKTVAKPIMVSLGANVAKEGVEKIGAGEKAQTYTKLGTMLLLDLTGKKSARALGKELYKDAGEMLPEGAEVSAKNLGKSIDALEKKLLKGGTTPSKTPVLTKIKELKDKFKDGKIAVEELQEFKRNVNEVSSALYDLPSGAKAKLKSNFNAFRSDIKSTIDQYGKENPEFLKVWNQAEEVHAAINQSQKVRKMMGSVVKKNPKLGYLTAGLVAGKVGVPHLLAAVPAYGALEAAELTARIMKSPVLRAHYQGAINAAIKENVPVMTKNLIELDKELKESE